MAQNITTPAEVIAIAFGDGEWLSPEAISTADISAATELWIRPIVGQALLDEVAKGGYAQLKTEYIIPAVAMCTRLLVQPRLNVQTSQLGLSSPAGSHHKAADGKARAELQRALRLRAQAMRERLSEHLEQHAAEYKEYRSEENILNRCRCDGGLVQIL